MVLDRDAARSPTLSSAVLVFDTDTSNHQTIKPSPTGYRRFFVMTFVGRGFPGSQVPRFPFGHAMRSEAKAKQSKASLSRHTRSNHPKGFLQLHPFHPWKRRWVMQSLCPVALSCENAHAQPTLNNADLFDVGGYLSTGSGPTCVPAQRSWKQRAIPSVPLLLVEMLEIRNLPKADGPSCACFILLQE